MKVFAFVGEPQAAGDPIPFVSGDIVTGDYGPYGSLPVASTA